VDGVIWLLGAGASRDAGLALAADLNGRVLSAFGQAGAGRVDVHIVPSATGGDGNGRAVACGVACVSVDCTARGSQGTAAN
jgi:hypothetical protein